jgi:hypothetical protein
LLQFLVGQKLENFGSKLLNSFPSAVLGLVCLLPAKGLSLLLPWTVLAIFYRGQQEVVANALNLFRGGPLASLVG